ncbi:MAG: hypothetical protein FWE07_06265 [Turicibacter sp.]|nr:hypothetical protein [Turicibacter sp.]
MERSIELLEKELAENPEDIKRLTEIAAVYEFELEDYAQAKHYYEKVLALNPDHAIAREALEVLNDLALPPNLSEDL